LIGGVVVTTVSLIPIGLGFGAVGVALGSIAAATQSAIGLVSAGSWFATATSLGMKGYFAGSAIAGGVIFGAGAVLNYFSKK